MVPRGQRVGAGRRGAEGAAATLLPVRLWQQVQALASEGPRRARAGCYGMPQGLVPAFELPLTVQCGQLRGPIQPALLPHFGHSCPYFGSTSGPFSLRNFRGLVITPGRVRTEEGRTDHTLTSDSVHSDHRAIY